ncbi:hypothetical protein BD777DRAFT_3676 [Yarrowia lipolytica]|jgi:hypothetical protein|uniref:Uncharacterized protein n=1 Tax=Yarrowia lipolytica TaxID=4952 RepID=A0A1D8N7G8_YARLL|nr:hypothetical protein YALI1_B15460g [Yarrowia lipolytica]RMJ01115.1 hypothetical protein BD777DRAFT_3676 [Yarrowia lipolytica]
MVLETELLHIMPSQHGFDIGGTVVGPQGITNRATVRHKHSILTYCMHCTTSRSLVTDHQNFPCLLLISICRLHLVRTTDRDPHWPCKSMSLASRSFRARKRAPITTGVKIFAPHADLLVAALYSLSHSVIQDLHDMTTVQGTGCNIGTELGGVAMSLSQ